MVLILVFSIISLFACIVGLIMLIINFRKIAFNRSAKFVIFALILLFGFNAFANVLEYGKITVALDLIGDTSQGLQPFLWGILLYDLALGIIEKDRKEIERKIQKKNRALEKKTKQLERFARVAVGREEKMIELKKRIVENEREKRSRG